MLAQQAATAHDRAVRWRQLVELVARAPSDGDGDLVGQAISEIESGRTSVDERVRVAAALAIASLPLPAGLVSAFAADRLNVAAPVLASARLTASEWKHVSAAASEDCRAFIAAMRAEQPQLAQPPARAPDEHSPIPSISEVVARIERLRHAREDEDEPPSEAPETPRLFRWECNETGDIDWVDGAPRGALVGQSIAQGGSSGGVDRSVERAFASRAPFHDGMLELPSDVSVGGTWRISGVPAFERSSGRFAGYRGVAERADGGGASPNEPASLRELAHEIRTPLNAIIGFAEMIAGEYLGPAGSRYRERASEIVAQARLLLTAVEDLDFAARLSSASEGDRPDLDLGELVESMAPALRELAASKGCTLVASRTAGDLRVRFHPELAQRLITRMCGAAIDAADGESLRLTVEDRNDSCCVAISRPTAFQGQSDADLLGSGDDALAKGFSLRLVRGLAKAAGASLLLASHAFMLEFPRK